MNRDNSIAMQEQEEILDAIRENSVLVEIHSSSALGATLLAFNQTARQYGKPEMDAQAWVEQELPNALLARKRTWEYSAKTKNNKAFVEEMKAISKLFTIPESTHVKYQERMLARFEAEQACRVKYGVQ